MRDLGRRVKSSSGVYLISNSPAIMSMEKMSQISFENHATSMNIIFIVSEVSILQIYADCRYCCKVSLFIYRYPGVNKTNSK